MGSSDKFLYRSKKVAGKGGPVTPVAMKHDVYYLVGARFPYGRFDLQQLA